MAKILGKITRNRSRHCSSTRDSGSKRKTGAFADFKVDSLYCNLIHNRRAGPRFSGSTRNSSLKVDARTVLSELVTNKFIPINPY